MSKLLRVEVMELQWLGSLRGYRLSAKQSGDDLLVSSVQSQIDKQMNVLAKLGLIDEDGNMDKHCQMIVHRSFVLTMLWKTNFQNEEIDYV